MAEAIVEEYRSSLSELSFNSKPHINMLTMLAEDNVQHADQIVETIVAHINAVPPPMKLPGMYLVDSVIKNIGGHYIPLFGSHMTTLFTSVFEKVEENTRSQLYKLRLTWKDILPNNVLHHLDSQIRQIDPAWPIIATEPPKQIHVNPKFLGAPETEESEAGDQNVEEQTTDEREKNDMKQKQLEVIKELQEKKEKLRKYELALREKIEKPKSINIVAPTVVQPSFVNTRDPRLKKAYATSGQVVPPLKSFVSNQLNTSSLQSVVVVPNAKTSNVNDVKTENDTTGFHQVISSNDEVLGKVQEYKNNRKAFSSANEKQKINDLSPKSKSASFKRKQAKDIDTSKNSDKFKAIQNREQNYDKSTSKRSHCENSRQNNARRSVSPPLDEEHVLQKNLKKLSKQISPRSRLNYQKDVLQRVGNQESKHLKTKFDKRQPLTQVRKRGKELLLKYKNTEENEPARKKKKDISMKNQSHVQSAYIYGKDDKDYRSLKIKDPEGDFSKRSTFFYTERSSSHSPQYRPNFESHKENDREDLYRGKYSYYIDRVMRSPYTVMRQAEEKYNSGTISKIVYQELCQNIREMMENEELYNCYEGMKLFQADGYPNIQHKELKYSMKEECIPERNIVSSKSVISSEPAVKSFKLDDEMRNIYFVDKKAFTLMNNNEPRELIFDGPPRNVYIEGITHPLRLGFNGHSAEFEIGGRLHTVQFGVPGREIYVNSVPFEASFGGSSFVALLGDGKLHRIQIDGPPPRVLTSQFPAYELFEKFRSLHSDIPLPQIENSSSSEKIDGLRDIDMRVRNITKSGLGFVYDPSTVKDIDWRQINHSEATQTVLELSKPSYHRSYQSAEPELNTSENHLEKCDRQNSSEFDGKLLCPPEAKAAAPLKPPPLGPFLNPALLSNSIQKTELPYSVSHTTVVPSMSNNNIVFSNASVPNVSVIDAALSSLNSIAKSLPQVQGPTLTTITTGSSMQPTYETEAIFPRVAPATVSQQIPNQQWQPLLPPPPFLGSLRGPEHMEQNPHQAASLSVPAIQPPLLPNLVPSSSSVPPSSDSTISSVSTAPKMNVELFLEKLIAAGIIGKKKDEPLAAVTSDLKSSDNSVEEVKDADEEIIPVIQLVPKSLREYHPVVINLLYKGSQCATCGMRFKEIQSEHYSRHLDWHFRTNRREKDGAKKPLSRRLFYEIKDWVDFKEFEDFEERAPSYFELQASGEQMKETEKENIISVPSERCETEICSVCGEQFQLFWVEEEEEWHLKHAVRHNDQVYHPACYEDFCKASEKPSSSENELDDSVVVEEPEDKVDMKPNSEAEVKMDVESNSATDNQDSATAVKDESEPLDSKPAAGDATSETVITVKIEPVDEPVSTEQSVIKEEIVTSEPSDTSAGTQVEKVANNNDESTNEEKISEAQSESSQTGTEITVKEESDDEVEFRPPTPDPNFENLPPVLRGSELSALCCIM